MDQAATAACLIVKKRIQTDSTRHRITSEILHDIVGFHGDSITIRDLSAQLGDRGFGLMLVLFALPNTIPLPIPGVSTLTSVPLVFFAAQLCLGRQQVWLPDWIANRQIPMGQLRSMLQRTLPWLRRLEKLFKPRLDKITTRNFECLAGGLILGLALLIALPIPLGNLPLGIAMAVLALAITERDGLLMIAGWLFTIIALCFFAMLVSGYSWLIWQFVSDIL